MTLWTKGSWGTGGGAAIDGRLSLMPRPSRTCTQEHWWLQMPSWACAQALQYFLVLLIYESIWVNIRKMEREVNTMFGKESPNYG
jgi:hypothetical protein